MLEKYLLLIKVADLFDREGHYGDADDADNELAGELADFFQIAEPQHNNGGPKLSDEELNAAIAKATYEYDLRKHLHEQGHNDPLFDDEGPTDEQLHDIEGEKLINGW